MPQGGPNAGQPSTQVDPLEAASPSAEAAAAGGSARAVRGSSGLTSVTALFAPVGRTARRVGSARRSAGRAIRAALPAEMAGVLLARLTVLPAIMLLAWLIPAVPLLLAHAFAPLPMLLISVPLAIVLIVLGLRLVPATWPRLLPSARAREPAWATWFGLLATVAVVAALTGWQLADSSQALIVIRDPGVYLQTGYWIAQHGSLPIPEQLAAFGGPHAGLSFVSTGFLTRGSAIYPAATPGLPLILAGGFWVHGSTGAIALAAILGGLAVLTFAGLVARLVGPQWAPAAAVLLGVSMPQQFVARSALSETALQIVLFGGLCLLADSVALRPGRAAGWWIPRGGEPPADWVRGRLAAVVSPERSLAAIAGLSIGFGLVLSLDGLLALLPLIPFCCALFVGHRPQAAAFPLGIGIGVCYGLIGCFLLDRPFLDSVGRTVGLEAVIAIWLIALAVVVTQAARVRRVRQVVPRLFASRPLRWLPGFAATLVLAALVGLAVRPYVQKAHGQPSPADYGFIASLQHQQGLPVDPTRTYAEQTLYWVIWYIGLPTVLLGAVGLALVVRRSLRTLLTWRDPTDVWRMWALPAAVICVGAGAVLWSPDIVPDQPWASRRLIVIAIPGLILGGLWAASWLARRARERGARPATAGAAALFCFAAMLLPTVATTFGLGLSHTGKSGELEVVTQEGMALHRIGAGQIEAVSGLCAQIPRNATVVIVDWPTAAQFAPVVRGMCDVPTAWMRGNPASSVDAVLESIASTGRQPVLLADAPQQLAGFGGTTIRAVNLVTTEEPHQLTQLPTAPQRVHYQVWLTMPAPVSFGA
jgi:hypothetical protein